MTLSDRLQAELENVYDNALDGVNRKVTVIGKINVMVSNIEADLVGLVDTEPCWEHNEPYDSVNIADSIEINGKYYPDCPTNELVADRLIIVASLKHYCRTEV